jgi:hypothetical protein
VNRARCGRHPGARVPATAPADAVTASAKSTSSELDGSILPSFCRRAAAATSRWL